MRAADNAEDALEALYEERLRGMRAPRSVLTYRWLRKAVLRVAKAARGQPLTLGELFALPDLLGLALTNDRNPDGARISKSTLAHRGTAMRSVATLLYVELAAALGRDPHDVLDQALRGAAERVGGGFRIAGGSPRRHGGPTPGMAEITAIIEALGEPQGWLGLRNRAFFTILAATGLRVNALRAISLNARAYGIGVCRAMDGVAGSRTLLIGVSRMRSRFGKVAGLSWSKSIVPLRTDLPLSRANRWRASSTSALASTPVLSTWSTRAVSP